MDSVIEEEREKERKKVVFFLIRELQRERNGLGGSGTKPWSVGVAGDRFGEWIAPICPADMATKLTRPI